MPDSARLRASGARRFVAATMPSLAQILAAHAPVLMLDAASTRVQVGWFPSADPHDAKWEVADEEAGTGVFRGVERLGIDLGEARAFVFCDGPGSVLGIRTTAMAVRAWRVLAMRPAFAYGSLALVAESLPEKNLTIIADARREMWHAQKRGGPLARVPARDLSGDLATPENFRAWSQAPANVRRVPYTLANLWVSVANADLLHPTDAPDAFLHEEPSYAAWTPMIHRAPEKS